MRIDRAVGADVVDRLQPLGIEAAFAAIEAQHATCGEKRRHIELALEQARYEATRAGRQYDAVDPENRIVATELERRWNERLLAVRGLENELDELARHSQTILAAADRDRLLALGADVERAWNSPGATAATRKRIVRTLIDEIIVRIEEDALALVIRWQGGDHTSLNVRKNRRGEHR